MNSQSLEIFAKHFGKKLDLDIVFEDGACPSTNGKQITLPSDMDEAVLIPTLGALIHETGHIRLTDFSTLEYVNSKTVMACLNSLEDIRVDCKSVTDYPEVQALLHRLVSWAITGKEAQFKAEPLPCKILKTLYLKGIGLKGYDVQADKVIAKLELEKFITLCKELDGTMSVLYHAKELDRILNAVQNDITNNQGANSGLSPEDMEAMKGQAKDFQKSLEGKAQELKKAYEEACIEDSKAMDELDKAKKELTRAKTKLTRNTKKAKEAEASGDVKTQAKAEAKADEAEAELDEAKLNAEEAQKESNGSSKARNQAYKKASQAQGQAQADDTTYEGRENKNNTAFGGGQGTGLTGFNALEGKATEEPFRIPKSLQSVLKEFFMKQKEENCTSEEGNRLHNRKLTGIFTGKKDIFKEVTKKDKKTLVSFMVDSSGSMGSLRDSGSRSSICFNSLLKLVEGLDKAIKDEDLNIEYSIHSFKESILELKSFTEKLNTEYIKSGYRIGGGTLIAYNVENVSKKMIKYSEEARKIIIVLTDGSVSTDELNRLLKNPDGIETKYIGIQLSKHNDNVTKLFGKNNIQKLGDILPVLTKVLLEGIR